MPNDKIKLVLHGYVPVSQNVIQAAHWTAHLHEKRRALAALKSALRYSAGSPLTGTTGSQNPFRIYLSTLESWQATTGFSLKGVSVRDRYQRRKKKEQKLK